MPFCGQCGHPLAVTTEVCPQCETPLARRCPSCGETVPGRNKFCGQCGMRMPEAGYTPTSVALPHAELSTPSLTAPSASGGPTGERLLGGERREVTVLFLDVVNFTAAAHELDSEDVFVWIDEVLRLLAGVVVKYEGTVDKFTGDGLMALFGVPMAHENDPERAVRAALEMQAELSPVQAKIKAQYGFEFRVRVGINSGLTTAGLIGGDTHPTYTVLGDVVNLASRLEAAAAPGTILVSLSTYQRTQPLFHYEALAPLIIKGMPDPVTAYQPLGLCERPGSVRGVPGLRVPMIGRSQDLARLRAQLALLCRHKSQQVAFVLGEAGLGKSRLIAEFRSGVPAHLQVYAGACQSYTRSTPFWVVAALLRDLLGIVIGTPAEDQRRNCVALLGLLGLPERVSLYLTAVLGIEQGDAEAVARLRLLDANMLQQQTHAALRQLFLALARRAPTILIFDDLHWVDPASRDFLRYLLQSTPDAALMVVGVSRDADHAAVIQPLLAVAQRHPTRLVEIQLQALSAGEGQLLLDQLIEARSAEVAALKQVIRQRTMGNPFYMEEMVRMLIDHGGLAQHDGRWTGTPQAGAVLQEVPETLKGLILARFDRLPAPLRATLQIAAILGHAFSSHLLQLVQGQASATTQAHLTALEKYQFLVSPHHEGEPRFTFRHALIQEAIVGTLMKRDRMVLHDAVARVIEAHHVGTWEDQTEMLAYHYSQGSTPVLAVPALFRAAENAARRSAYESAVRFYRRVLELLPPHTEGEQPPVYFQALIGLGQGLKFVGEFAEAGAQLLAARQALQAASADPAVRTRFLVALQRELADLRQREGALDEAIHELDAGIGLLEEAQSPAEQRRLRMLLDRLAWVRFRQGRLDEAFAVATLATQSATEAQVDDPATLASLYNTLSGVSWRRGDLDAATVYLNQSLAIYERLDYTWGLANSYTNLGVLHYTQGDWATAARLMERANELREQIGDIPNKALNLNNLGFLRMSLGDHEAARRDLEASFAIRQRLGDNWGIAQSQNSLAALAIVQGRFDEAHHYASAALALATEVGSVELQVQARPLLALVEAQQGALERGRQGTREALAQAKAIGAEEEQAACLRILGILEGQAGEFAAAEQALRHSVMLCAQQNDGYHQGLALLELGRLYLQQARHKPTQALAWYAEADEALHDAFTAFQVLGAAHDLQQAEDILAQVHGEVDGLSGSGLSSWNMSAAPQPAFRRFPALV